MLDYGVGCRQGQVLLLQPAADGDPPPLPHAHVCCTSCPQEYLISQAVDTKKADYAVVTGVQVGGRGGLQLARFRLAVSRRVASRPVPPAHIPAHAARTQIHNWAHDLEDEKTPSMEFVAPASMYVVVGGEKTELDVSKV